MIGESRVSLLINPKYFFRVQKMPKKTTKKKSPKKGTAKQIAARKKFKAGIAEYKKYKKSNPSGTKKVQSFIKEAF